MKALICGSFDPVTNGHLDIIRRTAALFDSVTVGIFINSDKKYLFSAQKRLSLLSEATIDLKNVTVDSCDGLVAKYVEKNNIDVIVKGIRNARDAEYELEMAKTNKLIYGKAETLLMPASTETELLSSTLVKAMFFAGEDITSYVPKCVRVALLETKP